MALLVRQDASGLAGAQITPVAAAAGLSDTIVGGQCVMLYVNNGGGSPITVTMVTPEQVEGALAVADRAIVVTNATWKLIPVPSRYNDPITGLCTVQYTAVATVTVAAILGTPQP